jgi:TP901 family phage tail tape measure protein
MAEETERIIYEVIFRDEASAGAGAWEKKLGDMENASRKTASAFSQFNVIAGRLAEKTGRELIAFLKDCSDSFGEFQQGMVDINKVAGGTEVQIKKLGDALREAVITELKGVTTLSQLQAIAQESSKFGIPIQNLDAFSVSIAKMATMWDMSATKSGEVASKVIAEYRLTADQIEKIGSAIDLMGDSLPAAEAQILNFTQKVSGMANNTGQNVATIAAIGAEILSRTALTGQSAGSSYSRIMQEMQGDTEKFSDFMKIDVQEWTRLINTQGDVAFQKLLTQLQQVRDTEGPGKMIESLKNLFGENINVNQLLTAMLGLSGEVAQQILAANEAYKEGSRISENFTKTINTQQASMAQVKAQWNDLKISIGEDIAPAISTLLTNINDFFEEIRKNGEAFHKDFSDNFSLNTARDFWSNVFTDEAKAAELTKQVLKDLNVEADLYTKNLLEILEVGTKKSTWPDSENAIGRNVKLLSALNEMGQTYKITLENVGKGTGNLYQTTNALAKAISEVSGQIRVVAQSADTLKTATGMAGAFGAKEKPGTGVFGGKTNDALGTYRQIGLTPVQSLDAAASQTIERLGEITRLADGTYSNLGADIEQAAFEQAKLNQTIQQGTEATRTLGVVATGHSTFPEIVSWAALSARTIQQVTVQTQQMTSALAQASQSLPLAKNTLDVNALKAAGLPDGTYATDVLLGARRPQVNINAGFIGAKAANKELANEQAAFVAGEKARGRDFGQAYAPPAPTIIFQGTNVIDERSMNELAAKIGQAWGVQQQRTITKTGQAWGV